LVYEWVGLLSDKLIIRYEVVNLRRILPIIRQWYYRLWARSDEFDISLSFDVEYYIDIKHEVDRLNKKLNCCNAYERIKIDYYTNKLKWYEYDLCKRRGAAHEKDMKKYI